MNDLDKLAVEYGADKFGKHHYTLVYYDLFKDRRDKVKKVLEIGTAEGASLFMWRDFFPNATIYGGEIDQKRVDIMKGEDRIEMIQMDQGSIKDLNKLLDLLPELDLVVDDGSHEPIDQLFTCYGILPFLKKGAIYVIEDVRNTDIAVLLADKYFTEVKRVGNRYDDQLIIIKK